MKKQMEEQQLSVVVNNGGKLYRSSATAGGNRLVFRRVNLNVPPGTVYGLLGPSGCGKTTLLRCILGRLNLDRGSVSVFGHQPGTAASGVPGPIAGYMPQDTCIPDTLSIGECWAYYGTIAGMSEQQIASAVKYFIRILNLPSASTVNGQLSGGELRRVAFATALIHRPKLLILDEPTVGIDCITKKNMWDHLLKVAIEEGTSIILTTHYIEEARAAHKVGLMQGGTLAIEAGTEDLLDRFGCSTLEDVFLSISHQGSSSLTNAFDPEDGNMQRRRIGCFSGPFEAPSIRALAIKAVIKKNVMQFYRFPGILLFLALLPCVQISISIMSFGTDFGRHSIGVVNKNPNFMGSQYLETLEKKNVNLEYFNSSTSGLKALQSGDVRVLITIPHNFSNSYLERILSSSMIINGDVSHDRKVNIVLDSTDFEITTFLRTHFLTSYGHFLHTIYSFLGLNAKAAQPVVMLEEQAIDQLSKPNSLINCTAIILKSCFFMAVAVAVVNLFVERTRGYLERSIVAGLKPAELVLGLLVTLMTILSVQVAIVVLVSFLVLFHDLTLAGSLLLFAVLYCHGMCGLAFGILVSLSVSQTYLLVSFNGAVIIFCGAITGGFWPLAAMPIVFRYVVLALPMAIPLRALSAIITDAAFTPAMVMSSMACSLTWTAVFLTISLAILKMSFVTREL